MARTAGRETMPQAIPRLFKRITLFGPSTLKEKEPAIEMEDEGPKMKPRSWLLNPRSKAIRNWDLYVALLLVFTAIVTPFEVSFLDSSINALFFVNRTVDLSFFIDMQMQFILPYQDDEATWVYSHRHIINRYLTGWFAIDLVSIFPFDIFSMMSGSKSVKIFRVVRLLRLMKLLRVLRAGRMFKRWESTVAVDYAKLSLCQFVGTVLLIAHWLACAWHAVLFMDDADYDPEARCSRDGVCSGPPSWLTEYAYISHNPAPAAISRYIVSMYWAIATLSTLGYGDVVPTTDVERAFVILSTIGGASVYAYMVGAVCNIIASMDEARSKFYRNIDSLNRFFAEKNVLQSLRVRCRDYLRFKQTNTGIEDYHIVIGQMSRQLRGEVAEHLHTKALNNVPLFQGASQDFQIAVALAFKTEAFSRGEYVVRNGHINTSMYILYKGLVMCRGKLIGHNGVFGEESLFRSSHQVANYAAVTITNTVLHSLSCDKFQRILMEFPTMKQKVRKIIVRAIFRDTILDYVKKVKQALRLGHMACKLERMFPAHFLPLYYDHKYAYIAQEDPIMLNDLISAAVVIQKNVRGMLQRIRYRKLLQRRQATSPEQLKLERIISLHGMPSTYLDVVRDEMLELPDLLHLSPGCLRTGGFKLKHAIILLRQARQVAEGRTNSLTIGREQSRSAMTLEAQALPDPQPPAAAAPTPPPAGPLETPPTATASGALQTDAAALSPSESEDDEDEDDREEDGEDEDDEEEDDEEEEGGG